jgi:hypothetical protein
MAGGTLGVSDSFSSMDTMSKRWLTALGLAVLVSIAILTRSFIDVLSPPQEKSDTAQQPLRGDAGESSTKSESTWSIPPEARAFDNRQNPPSVFPTDKRDKTVRKKDDAAIKAAVHQQAESLRALVKQHRLPHAYGSLTLKQIDEMEKNNILNE